MSQCAEIGLQVLVSLKQLYWPWRATNSTEEDSMFLQAATSASRGTGMTAPTSPFESLFHAPSSSRCNSLLFAQSNYFSRLSLFGHVLPSILLVPARPELGHSDFSTM
jgi:hypothetical protein